MEDLASRVLASVSPEPTKVELCSAVFDKTSLPTRLSRYRRADARLASVYKNQRRSFLDTTNDDLSDFEYDGPEYDDDGHRKYVYVQYRVRRTYPVRAYALECGRVEVCVDLRAPPAVPDIPWIKHWTLVATFRKFSSARVALARMMRVRSDTHSFDSMKDTSVTLFAGDVCIAMSEDPARDEELDVIVRDLE